MARLAGFGVQPHRGLCSVPVPVTLIVWKGKHRPFIQQTFGEAEGFKSG